MDLFWCKGFTLLGVIPLHISIERYAAQWKIRIVTMAEFAKI